MEATAQVRASVRRGIKVGRRVGGGATEKAQNCR